MHCRERWGPILFPTVVGHEVAGYICLKGKNVSEFNIDDYVGVSPLRDFCGTCKECLAGLQNICNHV